MTVQAQKAIREDAAAEEGARLLQDEAGNRLIPALRPGVVISHGAAPLPAADLANLAALRAELGARLVGEIPTLAPGRLPEPSCLELDAVAPPPSFQSTLDPA